MHKKKLLVHLHLYYHEQLNFFIKKLKNISGCDWDLYVTVCETNSKTEALLKAFKPDVKIIKVENIGYDVWPFIQVLRLVDKGQYDYVLKLHTKSSYGNFKWRGKLVNSLLETRRKFRNNFNLLEKKSDIGFICAKYCYLIMSSAVPEEQYMLYDMMHRLNLEYRSNMFLAGTMFLAKISCFNKIIYSDICAGDFCQTSKTKSSATNAHVLERVFTQAVLNEGFKIHLISLFWVDLGLIVYKIRRYLRIVWEQNSEHQCLLLRVGKRRYALYEKTFTKEIEGVETLKMEFSKIKNSKRVCVFAGYCPKGRITDAQIYYLRGLREICDNIIFIVDSKILPEELEKIKDLVCYCEFDRHQGYDFMSYKIGYNYAKSTGLLEGAEELIICNDSCYAPIVSFKNMFEEMDKCFCDFWGITSYFQQFVNPKHIQSYFYVFKSNVFNSKAFDKFLFKIRQESNVNSVIRKYELKFTAYLEKHGFRSASFVPENTPEIPEGVNKMFFPKTLIKKYNIPVVKLKVFNNKFGAHLCENSYDVLKSIEAINPELCEIIKRENDI